MSYKITYELFVEGSTDDLNVKFPVKFFVTKIDIFVSSKCYIYEVWFSSNNLIIPCKQFPSEIEAIRYISVAMKYAMKSNFIYQVCMFCYKNVFYPHSHCPECTLLVYHDHSMWYIQKFEIEKIPKHLGLFIKNVYRPSKRYSSIIIRS
jgi:hypothetical protein